MEHISIKFGTLHLEQFWRSLSTDCVCVKVTHLCPTLYDPMDYTVHGILQARMLEWVAFPFSRGSSQLRDQTQFSHIAGGFFYQLSHRGSPNTDYLYPKQCFSHIPDQQQFNKHVLSRAWGWCGYIRTLL